MFDGSIVDQSHAGAAGDLAVVFDPRRRFRAIGLWDPTSAIRLRVLHAGSPTPIDDAFFDDRIGAAHERRDPVRAGDATTGYRVVNGESDGLPGLVIDRYGDVAVVKLYSPAWFPWLPTVVRSTAEHLPVSRIVLRVARTVTALGPPIADGATVHGEVVDGPIPFAECGLRFEADVVAGQKTGHFLDQRDNRSLVGGLAAGTSVLDVFCCTGGFGVHAAAGGATDVHSVDAAPAAIATARRNMECNAERPEVAACRHTCEVGDAFEVLRRLAAAGERFGVVVVDPPSFAPRADRVAGALRAYAALTRLGAAVTQPGGVLVQSSCSSRVDAPTFHDLVSTTARDTGRVVEELARTGHALDHPATFREAHYLKTSVLRLR